MKIVFSWLKELVELPWTPEDTAARLTELGFPLESLEKTGVQASGIVTAKILSVEKHPNADRLRIAQVEDGKGQRTVVCGAPNIAPGQTVPLALPGAKLKDLEIVVSKIRGVESHGMLCSERELGLSAEHAGILILPDGTALGRDLREVLGQDAVLDIDVTPNRPDVLSHVGVAREISALLGSPLKSPALFDIAGLPASKVPVRIDDARCTRYMGAVVRGVKVAPSPDWLARRLNAAGIRAINNVVDITNLVLLEFGHPLHAFDMARLSGPTVTVRSAVPKESFKALDGRDYVLAPEDVVVADAKSAVAIAGIMGGELSGVQAGTTDVFLESAVFDRASVRRTSRRLVLKSESSIRFEKGVDRGTAEAAFRRALRLLVDLAGGSVEGLADAGAPAPAPTTIRLRRTHLDRLLGHTVPDGDVEAILARLGLNPRSSVAGWDTTVPPHRKDLLEEADLVEEVARVTGYDRFPSRLSVGAAADMPAGQMARDTARLSDILRGMGVSETMSSSFLARETAARFGAADGVMVELSNPLSKEESILRTNLVPHLVRAVQRNVNVQREAAHLFEIGRRFRMTKGGREETLVLGLALYGSLAGASWNQPSSDADVFTLKGLIASLDRATGTGFVFQPGSAEPFLHPGRSFTILFNGVAVGWAGHLHPALAAEYDLKKACAIAEIEVVDPLVSRPRARTRALPRFPFVERDVAAVLPNSVAWADVEKVVRSAAGTSFVEAHPFDVFEGKSLPAGHRSLAFRIRLQHPDRTLQDADINAAVDGVRAALKERCGAQFR